MNSSPTIRRGPNARTTSARAFATCPSLSPSSVRRSPRDRRFAPRSRTTTRATSRTRRAFARSRETCCGRFPASSSSRSRSRRSAAAAPASTTSCNRRPALRSANERRGTCIAAAPDIIATGNPGCTLQIRAACAKLGTARPVLHPMEDSGCQSIRRSSKSTYVCTRHGMTPTTGYR